MGRVALALLSAAAVVVGVALTVGLGPALVVAGIAGLAIVFNQSLREGVDRARAAAAEEAPEQ